MPYLRMFLRDQQIDEVFISDVFLESVLGSHFLEEEKNIMLKKHSIKNKEADFSFDVYPPNTDHSIK